MHDILAVAERIKQDLTKAIAAARVVRAAVCDDELVACFNVGFACDAFDLIRHSLLFFQLITLVRLWDDRKDVYSIEALFRLFSNVEVKKRLVERERQALHDIRKGDTILGEGSTEMPFPPVSLSR